MKQTKIAIPLIVLIFMLILLVGCSKSNKEIIKDSINGIGRYSQELFNYIDKDNNSKIAQDEFVNYRTKQDEMSQGNVADNEVVVYAVDDISPEYNRTKEFYNLFEKADSNSDGSLDFKEFKMRFHSYNRREYEDVYIQKLYIYITKNSELTLSEIASKSNLFKEMYNQECNVSQKSEKLSYWIKIEFPKKMKSGTYKIGIVGITFDKHSFTKIQEIESNNKFVKFHYDTKRDKRIYYFKVNSFDIHMMGYISQKTEELEALGVIKEPTYYEPPTIDYYSNPNIILLFSGLGIGLIFMASLYNLAIFYNYRRREFLYYSLLQIGMVTLLYMLINQHSNLLPHMGRFMMEFVGLFISLFATLFTQAFLETKKYLPKMHIIFNIYLVLIFIDAVWYADALLDKNHLYSVFGVLFLVAGVMRIIQGSKVAWFYLIGWLFLILATFLMEYYYSSVPFYTLFLGAGIEAIMLAWGLTYKMKSYER